MSVYIKGMEMPTNCDGCQLNYDCCACILTGSRYYKRGVEFDPEKGRLPDCPLIPVPPHGRCVDADALREDWLENGENEYVYDTNAFLDSLDAAPTIIPADKEE